MNASRLKASQRKSIQAVNPLDRLHVLQLKDMTSAWRLSQRQIWKVETEKDLLFRQVIGTKPIDGDSERLRSALQDSERLIEEAILLDPRLARRAQWKRTEEGESCDAGLLAMGDDQPCYRYSRAVVNEATLAGEPVKVVISTDDSTVPPGTAAAFIATARLVQQFMPLEIWWQGAWLTAQKTRGFVFLVPLVQGDMDFSRLEFCIADKLRDAFSFRVMSTCACLDLRQSWNGCGHRADYSYLEGARVQFVTHTGIEPTADRVAAHAARWLGWESYYLQQWEQESAASSATQRLPEPQTSTPYVPTAEDRLRWAKESREREKHAAARADSRFSALENPSNL